VFVSLVAYFYYTTPNIGVLYIYNNNNNNKELQKTPLITYSKILKDVSWRASAIAVILSALILLTLKLEG